jgi:hypothetical protein
VLYNNEQKTTQMYGVPVCHVWGDGVQQVLHAECGLDGGEMEVGSVRQHVHLSLAQHASKLVHPLKWLNHCTVTIEKTKTNKTAINKSYLQLKFCTGTYTEIGFRMRT